MTSEASQPADEPANQSARQSTRASQFLVLQQSSSGQGLRANAQSETHLSGEFSCSRGKESDGGGTLGGMTDERSKGKGAEGRAE